MIALLWLLNFGISILNAVGCGRTWDSTKAQGGGAHLMNWMGAIMSASGFTWCYMVLLTVLGMNISMAPAEAGGDPVPLLSPEMAQVFVEMGYLVIIFPILGSGLVITIYSWREVARRRTVGNSLIAGWNTYAQVTNTLRAAQTLPGVLDHLGDVFSDGMTKNKDEKGAGSVLLLLLVFLVAFAGGLTTYSIVQGQRRAVRQADLRREWAA